MIGQYVFLYGSIALKNCITYFAFGILMIGQYVFLYGSIALKN